MSTELKATALAGGSWIALCRIVNGRKWACGFGVRAAATLTGWDKNNSFITTPCIHPIAMPSETVYLKDRQIEILKEMVEQSDELENISQAVQYCVNAQGQRDMANNE